MATAALITITNHHTTTTYSAYDVTCFHHRVRTIVTLNPTIVTTWINQIRSSTTALTTVVGINTEWLNPIATLQLCVGPNCLIYSLIHSPSIPSTLVKFFRDPQWRFSGVGVGGDYKRLLDDYDLRLNCTVDMSKLAAKMGVVKVNAGLKTVAKTMLGWEMEKAKEIVNQLIKH